MLHVEFYIQWTEGPRAQPAPVLFLPWVPSRAELDDSVQGMNKGNKGLQAQQRTCSHVVPVAWLGCAIAQSLKCATVTLPSLNCHSGCFPPSCSLREEAVIARRSPFHLLVICTILKFLLPTWQFRSKEVTHSLELVIHITSCTDLKELFIFIEVFYHPKRI